MLKTSTNIKHRKELYSLIDKIPEKEIPSVKDYMEFIIAKSNKTETDSFIEFLKNVPDDDEELTEEELKELEEARKEASYELEKGKLISVKELKKLYGI